MVVNQMPWDSIEFERLSELFALCAVVLACASIAPIVYIVVWAVLSLVVMVVGGLFIVVKLYIRKSLSTHPTKVLSAWSTQLLMGSQCHVACQAIVSWMKAINTFWAWIGPSVGFRIHFINGRRCWTALCPWGAAFGNIAIVIPPPTWCQSTVWKKEHSSCSRCAMC